MNWSLIAVASALLLLAYLAVIDFVDLFPWNDIHAIPLRERIRDACLNYIPLLIIALGAWQQQRALLIVALVLSCLYVIGHLGSWWVPYLFGATEFQRTEYEKSFARTLKVLPAIGDHSVPDAEHLVVGLLIASMITSMVLTMAR